MNNKLVLPVTAKGMVKPQGICYTITSYLMKPRLQVGIEPRSLPTGSLGQVQVCDQTHKWTKSLSDGDNVGAALPQDLRVIAGKETSVMTATVTANGNVSMDAASLSEGSFESVNDEPDLEVPLSHTGSEWADASEKVGEGESNLDLDATLILNISSEKEAS